MKFSNHPSKTQIHQPLDTYKYLTHVSTSSNPHATPCHLHSTFSLLSLSLIQKMEVVSLCEHDNKENIPPFTSKKTDPSPPSFQFSTNNAKRRSRRPLRDITHLFNPSISAPFTTFQFHSAVLTSTANCRKRKAAGEDDSVQDSRSKLLRMGFR